MPPAISSYPHADHRRQYTPGEKVNLWVNKVGPYHNPQETYEYFSLPYCQVSSGSRPNTEQTPLATTAIPP